MKTFRLWIPLTLLFCAQCGEKHPAYQAPLLKGLGAYHVPVTTSSDDAQLFFNQGVILANAFNHGEAERSFREAVRLDTSFAMGYWGIAYVLGPNLNSADNLGTAQAVQKAVSQAERFSAGAADWEKALIHATRAAFPKDSPGRNADAHQHALKSAHEQFPGNTFLATLYAESLMNAHAWNFFERKGGKIQPWTREILNRLEQIMETDPGNPLAHHLYLHATESGSDFGKARKSAEQLKTLVPAAGHLIHMPSHIYINTGEYHEGSLSNEQAVRVDSAYVAECLSQGYYPQMYYTHNYHFLAATTAFEGRASRSIEAAFKTAWLVDKRYHHEPGFETVQHYLTIPDHVLIKFGQWEKILALPVPAADLIYPAAIRHYARGLALAHLNRAAAAEQELLALRKLTASPAIAGQMIWGINKVTDVCRIAANVLEAELYSRKGQPARAIPLLRAAVAIEDGLNYTEPPDWFFSVRHVLGNRLLETGSYAGAEQVYREDLARWPLNGYALNGLAESLSRQHKEKEAAQVRAQFTEAWKYAEVALKGSVIDPDKRQDLVLKVDRTSPGVLLGISMRVCR